MTQGYAATVAVRGQTSGHRAQQFAQAGRAPGEGTRAGNSLGKS